MEYGDVPIRNALGAQIPFLHPARFFSHSEVVYGFATGDGCCRDIAAPYFDERRQRGEEQMRFLVAEDDQALGAYLKRGLEAEGHTVRLAADGRVALEMFLEGAPEFAILDLTMPCKDGTEVLRQLRTVSEDLPVLILTARRDMETRLACLDLGADDCMAKPFAFAELRARVRALARRRRGDEDFLLRHGSLEMNRMERTVQCAGHEVKLTGKEFALLEHLLQNSGRAISRSTLLEEVWKMPAEAGTNVVDVYVNYLRRKLGEPAAALIQTVRGHGYGIGLRT